MMECKQYRTALLADPAAATADMRAHGDDCAECAQFTLRVEAFEVRLARAVRSPPSTSQRLPAVERAPRWYAIAATLVAAVGAAALLWLAVPRSSLAGDVVTHMAGEPDAWRRTTQAVSQAQLDLVMQDAHMRLAAATSGLVSYASSCAFRGHRVPHLVVQDPSGPVTVMVLPHESTRSAESFDENGYRGLILPVPEHGAMAILTQNQSLDPAAIDRIAAQLRAAIRWTN